MKKIALVKVVSGSRAVGALAVPCRLLLRVLPSLRYAVVDAQAGAPPQRLAMRRRGESLDNELIGRCEGAEVTGGVDVRRPVDLCRCGVLRPGRQSGRFGHCSVRHTLVSLDGWKATFPLGAGALSVLEVIAILNETAEYAERASDVPMLVLEVEISAWHVVAWHRGYGLDGAELGCATVGTDGCGIVGIAAPYKGVVLGKAYDVDDADYLDEANLAPQGMRMDLRAIAWIDGVKSYAVNGASLAFGVAQASTITSSQLLGFDANDLLTPSPEAVGVLRADRFASLNLSLLGALQAEQVTALTAEQTSGLSPVQVAALRYSFAQLPTLHSDSAPNVMLSTVARTAGNSEDETCTLSITFDHPVEGLVRCSDNTVAGGGAAAGLDRPQRQRHPHPDLRRVGRPKRAGRAMIAPRGRRSGATKHVR